MAFDFDSEVAKLDQIEDEHFGEEFTIEGMLTNVSGIFDESELEVESVDDFYTTIEVQVKDVQGQSLYEKSITRVKNGNIYTIKKIVPNDTKFILVVAS